MVNKIVVCFSRCIQYCFFVFLLTSYAFSEEKLNINKVQCNSDKNIITRINYPAMTIRDCSKDSCNPGVAISMLVSCENNLPYSYNEFFHEKTDCLMIDASRIFVINKDKERVCFKNIDSILDMRYDDPKKTRKILSYAVKDGERYYIFRCVWENINCSIKYNADDNIVSFDVPYQYLHNNEYKELLKKLVDFYDSGVWNEQH